MAITEEPVCSNSNAPKRLESYALPELQSGPPCDGREEARADSSASQNGNSAHDHGRGEANGDAGDAVAVLTAKVGRLGATIALWGCTCCSMHSRIFAAQRRVRSAVYRPADRSSMLVDAQVAELERQVAQLLQARAEFARAPSVPELQLPATIFDLQRCLGAQNGSQVRSFLSRVPGCPSACRTARVLPTSRPQCCGDAALTELMGPAGRAG